MGGSGVSRRSHRLNAGRLWRSIVLTQPGRRTPPRCRAAERGSQVTEAARRGKGSRGPACPSRALVLEVWIYSTADRATQGVAMPRRCGIFSGGSCRTPWPAGKRGHSVRIPGSPVSFKEIFSTWGRRSRMLSRPNGATPGPLLRRISRKGERALLPYIAWTHRGGRGGRRGSTAGLRRS